MKWVPRVNDGQRGSDVFPGLAAHEKAPALASGDSDRFDPEPRVLPDRASGLDLFCSSQSTSARGSSVRGVFSPRVIITIIDHHQVHVLVQKPARVHELRAP